MLQRTAQVTQGTVASGPRPELAADDWRRLNRLLAQALEVDGEDRAAWLAALPLSEHDLRPLLEDLLRRTGAPEPATHDTAPRDRQFRYSALLRAAAERHGGLDKAGQLIGPYRLLREIGRGGMGSVWLADRIDGVIDRQVALKLPRAEWPDRGLADRMARERDALAALNHPNIALLLDAGWAADGRPYLALEYVEGESIEAWCTRQTLDTRARIRLFVDVVRAVAFAHSKLVIHRDLKPSNVFVTAEGRVKLLDFGIAKLLHAGEPRVEDSALTRISGTALTLNYAAPEQVRGDEIGTASDTYSLGVMLFELVSGGHPYRPTRDSRAAMEEAILNDDPPAPSEAATDRSTKRTLRGDLDAIILKTLRKRPEDRYETAAAFADDLERWLGQRPVRARGRSGWYLARRFVARHRLGFVAGTAATAALLAGGGIALWQARAASEEAAHAAIVRDFVLSIIAQADPAKSRATREADLTLLTTAEERLASQLSGRPALALELRIAIARAYRNRGEFERLRATLQRAIADAEKTLPADDPRLARAWVEIADWQLGGDRAVGAGLDRAIETARRMGDSGVELLIDGLSKRAPRRALVEGRWADAPADVREAYDVAVRHLPAKHPARLMATAALSDLLGEADMPILERLAMAEESYTAALGNESMGPGDPRLIEIQRIHANNLIEAGRAQEGLRMFRAALESARTFHGGGLPTELVLARYWIALLATGDASGALAAAQEAYALAAARETAGGFNRAIRADNVINAALHARRIEFVKPMLVEYAEQSKSNAWVIPKTVWLMNFRGETAAAAALASAFVEKNAARWPGQGVFARLGWSYALRQDGRPEDAARVLEPVPLRTDTAWLELFESRKEKAAVSLALGDAAQALSLVDETIRRNAVWKLQTDPYMADLHLIRGQALMQLGRPAEAREAFESSMEFWNRYDADSNWAAEASYWLGRSLLENGDPAAGRRLLTASQARLASSPMPQHRRLAASIASTTK